MILDLLPDDQLTQIETMGFFNVLGKKKQNQVKKRTSHSKSTLRWKLGFLLNVSVIGRDSD